jgi:competence protein ComEC
VDALGKALLLMLLVAPASIRSIGLQLSFAATLAVLVALERLPFLRARPSAGARGVRGAAGRIGRAAVAAMVVSVVVEIVILPLQFHHFGRMSAVGPLATVLFFVPVTAVQVLAMAAAVVAGVPWVGDGVLACLSAASRATETAVLAAAAYAPEPLAGTGPHAILYYGALLVVWRWPRPRGARLLAAALLAASFRAGPDFW